MLKLEQTIEAFFHYAVQNQIELYNEFSLQHELGIFLRSKLNGYKVQFERNITFWGGDKSDNFEKKEIDICIFNADKSEKYAIELKFPQNGQHPEQMFSFAKDICFMEQVKALGFNQTFAVTLVTDSKFYSGQKTDGIYAYFRGKEKLVGKIQKPTGKKDEQVIINGEYFIQWQDAIVFNDRTEDAKYYIVSI